MLESADDRMCLLDELREYMLDQQVVQDGLHQEVAANRRELNVVTARLVQAEEWQADASRILRFQERVQDRLLPIPELSDQVPEAPGLLYLREQLKEVREKFEKRIVALAQSVDLTFTTMVENEQSMRSQLKDDLEASIHTVAENLQVVSTAISAREAVQTDRIKDVVRDVLTLQMKGVCQRPVGDDVPLHMVTSSERSFMDVSPTKSRYSNCDWQSVHRRETCPVLQNPADSDSRELPSARCLDHVGTPRQRSPLADVAWRRESKASRPVAQLVCHSPSPGRVSQPGRASPQQGRASPHPDIKRLPSRGSSVTVPSLARLPGTMASMQRTTSARGLQR